MADLEVEVADFQALEVTLAVAQALEVKMVGFQEVGGWF